MAADWIVLGRISGLFGVQGWVKVFSYTEPRDRIAGYRPLYLRRSGDWRPIEVEHSRAHGKGVVLKFAGCGDRDAAARLINAELAIHREQLPDLQAGEYYWADLEGLQVINVDGVELGRVEYLFDTGANDVVVVTGERQRLIPFLRDDVIKTIDLERGEMRVDWDADF